MPPAATGSIRTVALSDGTRAFYLRFRVDGRRTRVILHERKGCQCGCGGGWDEPGARNELGNIIARVRAGVWRPTEPLHQAPEAMPTFHEYASAWLQAKVDGVLGDTPIDANTELGYAVSFDATPAGVGGWCDSRAKRIVVDADAPANAQLRTLIHETAHALGVDYECFSRKQAEVIVDTVTFIVCAGVGLAVDGETIPYVAGWGEDGALNAVSQFADTIDRLARRIEDALQLRDRPEPARRATR
jgi:hypothetical protein